MILGKKLRNRLAYLKDFQLGMYPGDRWENAPKQYAELYKLGLVDEYIPTNPIHKTRAIISDLGRVVLEEMKYDTKPGRVR